MMALHGSPLLRWQAPAIRLLRRARLWAVGGGREAQLRHLSQSARLEEQSNLRLIRLTLVIVSLAILAMLGWAAQARVSELARAPGEVVPEGSQRSVQHLEGGIVSAIAVREGQLVAQGERLLELDGSGLREDLSRARIKQQTLQVQAERLRAFIAGRAPDFAPFAAAPASYLAEQAASFRSMVAASREERRVVEAQIAQKEEALGQLGARKGTVALNLELVEDLHERYRGLFGRGYLTRSRLVESEQELNRLRGEAAEIDNQIRQAAVALQEFRSRLGSLAAGHRDEAWRQLDAIEAELRQNQEVIAKLDGQVGRLELRAPVRGLVKGLAVNTIGAVVAPGQVLLEIVPLDETLMVEIRIPPQHIGHLSLGQPVQVRVSSYDFGRYGAVQGTLASVSATTFTGPTGERFYRGRVRLAQHHVGSDPVANPILPGMTVMADIVTGDKTVLDYLLKPIERSLKTAFTER
jgi:HlyD family secretion protein/adhesin transport system membrane fusion protein